MKVSTFEIIYKINTIIHQIKK